MNILQQRTPGFSSHIHPSPVLPVSPNVPPWPGCSDSKPQLCCISFSPTAPGPSASTDGSAFKTHHDNASSRFCLLPPFSRRRLSSQELEWPSKRQSGHFLTRYKCSNGSPSDCKRNPNPIPDSGVPHSPAMPASPSVSPLLSFSSPPSDFVPSALPSTQQALPAFPFSRNNVPIPAVSLTSPWLELSHHAGFVPMLDPVWPPYWNATPGLHPA